MVSESRRTTVRGSQSNRIVGVLLFELAAAVVLHLLGSREHLRIDWSNWRDWLDTAPAEDVIGAGLRLVALGIAYWLLLSTLAYAMATLSRRSVAIRATGWTTLPPIQRLVSRSVALSIAASSVSVPLGFGIVTPAFGSPAPGVVVEVDAEGVNHPPESE